MRVERGIGVLKDDLHMATVAAQFILAQVRDVHAIEQHLTCSRLEQTQHGLGHGGLAATGFADQTKGLAPRDVERHAIHREDLADNPRQQATVNRKVLLQIGDTQQRRGG